MRVVNLVEDHFLNSCIGRIISFTDSSDKRKRAYRVRCAVASESSGIRNPDIFLKIFRSDNLEPLRPDEFEERADDPLRLVDGDFVEIHDLVGAKYLNEKFGQVVSASSFDSTGRVSIAVGFLKSRSLQDDASLAHIKNIRPANLRRFPLGGCPIVDFERFTAEAAAEILWVWRLSSMNGMRYDSDLCTSQKIVFCLLKVEFVQKEKLLKFSCQMSLDTVCGRLLVNQYKACVLEDNATFDIFFKKAKVVRVKVSGSPLNLIERDDFRDNSGISAETNFECLMRGFEKIVMQPAVPFGVQYVKTVQHLLNNSEKGSILLVLGNGISRDYDHFGKDLLKSSFTPIDFDVRKISGVDGYSIPAFGQTATGSSSYRECVVYPSSENIRSQKLKRDCNGSSKFELTRSTEVETALGGYEKVHQLISAVLCIDKTPDMVHTLCDLFNQFEPQIVMQFRGRLVFNIRLVNGGTFTADDYERVKVGGHFSSKPDPGLLCNGTHDPDQTGGRNNWNCLHSWITFQIYEDGVIKTFILDMNAPMYRVYGKRIKVYDGLVPDVWSFIREAKDEPRYDATAADNVPSNMHSTLLLVWIYKKNNSRASCCLKIDNITSLFLERRYPPCMRAIPRPYNVPEFPDSSKFFGIGTTKPEDASAHDVIKAVTLEMMRLWDRKLSTISGPVVVSVDREEIQKAILELNITKLLEHKSGRLLADWQVNEITQINHCTVINGAQPRDYSLAKLIYKF